MYDALALLQPLHNLASQINAERKNAVTGVWDELLKLIEKLFRKILGEIITPIGNVISDVYTEVTTGISNKLYSLRSTISDAINGVKTTIYAAVGYIVDEINLLQSEITDAIQDVVSDISDAIRDVIERLVNAVEAAVDTLRNIGSTIANAISGAIAGIGNWIKTIVQNLITSLAQYLGGLIDAVRDWLSDAYNAVRDAVVRVYEGVRDWITGVYDAVAGWIRNTLEHLRNVYETTRETVETWLERLITFLQGLVRDAIIVFGILRDEVKKFIAEVIIPRFLAGLEGLQHLRTWANMVWEAISSGNFERAIDLTDGLFKGLGIPAPFEVIHGIVSLITYFWLTVDLQFVPLRVSAEKRANIALGLDPVSLEAAASAVLRGDASLDEYYHNAALAGATRDRANMVLSAVRAMPTPGQIQEGYLRGEIDEDTHDHLLSRYGYSEREIKLFKALYWIIPPPSDLIRMAVREVFSPEVAERFGQYEDYPEIFTEWAVKQGLSEEWAKRYWAAHWDLPSPTMAFEMFHRRIINADELKLLLRALDIMPYWRERLIQLSYNPLTRVDIRRMYKLGVLTEQDVYNAYLDLGYSPENASRLTEFTKRYSSPEDTSEQDEFRQLARGVYSNAYKRNVISTDEYRNALLTMGYHPDDANLLISIDDAYKASEYSLFNLQEYRRDTLKLILSAYDRGLYHQNTVYDMLLDLGYTHEQATLELSLSDYNRTLALRNLLVERIGEQYVSYIIDATKVHEILDMYNFTPEEIAKLLESWNIERTYRTRRPPISDIRRWYENGYLTTDEFLDELRGMGYNEKYIELYKAELRI